MPGLTGIEITCLDDSATGYATFQSHNQKVVSNAHGIFTAHIRSRNEAYTAQQWRLSRSVDGGAHFSVLYEATHPTNPPVLETDEEGNIYLVRPDFQDGNAYLYRFMAADQYAQPRISTIPGGAAGKYCMFYDPQRQQLYYFAHNNTFHLIGLDGSVRGSTTLLQAGPSALLQYPLLSLDRDGTLHAAWTTQKHGEYLYWDIHHMLSRDGGRSWERMDGTPLQLPVVADEHGPADGLVLEDEYAAHTWLSSFLAREGKLHFIYMAQTQPARQHYVRCEVKNARQEQRIWPEFKGEHLSLLGLDGLLSTRASQPGAPLYCVANGQGRLACLVSDDDGSTWHDYAVSQERFNLYSIGGCRELTADGHIIGTFTDQQASPQNTAGVSRVYFFKIRAGCSQ